MSDEQFWTLMFRFNFFVFALSIATYIIGTAYLLKIRRKRKTSLYFYDYYNEREEKLLVFLGSVGICAFLIGLVICFIWLFNLMGA